MWQMMRVSRGVFRVQRRRRQLVGGVFDSYTKDKENFSTTSAIVSDPTTVRVLSVLPTVFCTSLVMSPILTCRDIAKKKSIGALSPMPVVACANTCVVFTAFGSKLNDWVVMTPNIIGAVCSVYYLYTFQKYSPPGTMSKWYAGSIGVMGTSLLAAFDCLPLDPETSLNGLGYAASSLALWLALSPLSGLGHVIREKSTAGMPFPICLASTMNAASWVSYGYLVAGNPFLYYPNLIGFSAGVLQLSCFAVYGFPSSSSSSAPSQQQSSDNS